MQFKFRSYSTYRSIFLPFQATLAAFWKSVEQYKTTNNKLIINRRKGNRTRTKTHSTRNVLHRTSWSIERASLLSWNTKDKTLTERLFNVSMYRRHRHCFHDFRARWLYHRDYTNDRCQVVLMTDAKRYKLWRGRINFLMVLILRCTPDVRRAPECKSRAEQRQPLPHHPRNSNFLFLKSEEIKWHYEKVLQKRFQFTGTTIGFRPQILKLEWQVISP